MEKQNTQTEESRNPTYRKFDWMVKRNPTLIRGPDAKRLFRAQQKDLERFGEESGVDVAKYNGDRQEMYGSNAPITGQIYRIVAPSGLRVSVPGDDIDGNILKLLKERHLANSNNPEALGYYTDFNALVVNEGDHVLDFWIGKDEHGKKQYIDVPGITKIQKRCIELAEEKQGSVKFPFMLQGFYTEPGQSEDVKNYRWTIKPAQNFEIIEDDRLSTKYSDWKFDNVDERGLPLNLDRSMGSREFFNRRNGLSRVLLTNKGDLFANSRILTNSLDPGGLVLVNNDLEFKIKEPQESEEKDIVERKDSSHKGRVPISAFLPGWVLPSPPHRF
jgi:hypothetical protein